VEVHARVAERIVEGIVKGFVESFGKKASAESFVNSWLRTRWIISRAPVVRLEFVGVGIRHGVPERPTSDGYVKISEFNRFRFDTAVRSLMK
jgi:hypothetical protein